MSLFDWVNPNRQPLGPIEVRFEDGEMVDPEELFDTVVGFAQAALDDDESGTTIREKLEYLDSEPDGVFVDDRIEGMGREAAQLIRDNQNRWN